MFVGQDSDHVVGEFEQIRVMRPDRHDRRNMLWVASSDETAAARAHNRSRHHVCPENYQGLFDHGPDEQVVGHPRRPFDQSRQFTVGTSRSETLGDGELEERPMEKSDAIVGRDQDSSPRQRLNMSTQNSGVVRSIGRIRDLSSPPNQDVDRWFGSSQRQQCDCE
ncbi:hypothetical protein RN2511_026690 [Rhodococcus sp. NKCM2511]|nr:hypothetical protein RN2511_026690 [Rhodococcus sp. NKCM2511]